VNLINFARQVYLAALIPMLVGGGLTTSAHADQSGKKLPNIIVIGQHDDMLQVTIDPLKTPVTTAKHGEFTKRNPGGNPES